MVRAVRGVPGAGLPGEAPGEPERDQWGKEIPWTTVRVGAGAGRRRRAARALVRHAPAASSAPRIPGASWQLVRPLWDHPLRKEWFGGGADLPGIHSICVDPRQSAVVRIGVSCAGVWTTRDRGASWSCEGKGMWAAYMPPERKFEMNVQDPHRVVQCPAAPDRLWAQHHNGIFRSSDAGLTWEDIEGAPPSVFGFAVAVHPRDPDTAWFVPAIKDERRIPAGGRVVVTRTRDGGRTFAELTRGLPQQHAYDLVYRHALDERERRRARLRQHHGRPVDLRRPGRDLAGGRGAAAARLCRAVHAMKIATWNINGVKARLDTALTYLKDAHLDVLCLQEIKCADEAFPAGAFEELGYNVATHGQKGFNGVAILSKSPLEDVARGLPGAPDGGDAQSRYIEATSTPAGAVRVASSICRTAIRSAPRSSTTNSPGWSACTATPGAFSPTRCRSCSLATSTSSPNRSTPSARRRGSTTRCSSPRAAPRCAGSPTTASPTRCASAIPSPASTRSGTTRPAAGRRTTASASTTSCSRRKPPTGFVLAQVDRFARLGEAVRPRAGVDRARRLTPRGPNRSALLGSFPEAAAVPRLSGILSAH